MVYVDTVAAFEAFLSIGLSGCCELGLDAEYSTTHLAARVSLLQLATHRQVFLLDMEVGGQAFLPNIEYSTVSTSISRIYPWNMCGVGGLESGSGQAELSPPPRKGKHYFRSNKMVKVEKVTDLGLFTVSFYAESKYFATMFEKKLFTLRCCILFWPPPIGSPYRFS